MNVYLIGIIISFVAYLIIGFIISKRVKNANDFYVAGRNAPVFLIVGSMIASYASTGMFMGDAGEYYSGMFAPMTIQTTMQISGYIIGAVFFGRYLRRSQVYTIPEFFGKRFCSSAMHKLATVTAITNPIKEAGIIWKNFLIPFAATFSFLKWRTHFAMMGINIIAIIMSAKGGAVLKSLN